MIVCVSVCTCSRSHALLRKGYMVINLPFSQADVSFKEPMASWDPTFFVQTGCCLPLLGLPMVLHEQHCPFSPFSLATGPAPFYQLLPGSSLISFPSTSGWMGGGFSWAPQCPPHRQTHSFFSPPLPGQIPDGTFLFPNVSIPAPDLLCDPA